jgi:hypothetical protein
MGGAFNTVNLNLYHYAGNNPVVMSDPDGNKVFVENMDGKSITRFHNSRANTQKRIKSGRWVSSE